MTTEDLKVMLNTYVWGAECLEQQEAQLGLEALDIDLGYVESVIDYAISELAQFMTDNDNEGVASENSDLNQYLN